MPKVPHVDIAAGGTTNEYNGNVGAGIKIKSCQRGSVDDDGGGICRVESICLRATNNTGESYANTTCECQRALRMKGSSTTGCREQET